MSIETIIFDFGRTLFNPDTGTLFPDTIETLEKLEQKGIKMGLLSVAITEDTTQRLDELEDLGLIRFFQSVDIVPRNTQGKDFTNVLKGLDVDGDFSKCMVVGDNLKREIESGNKIGAYTVWTKQNLSDDWRPQNEMQIPKETISDIKEIIALVDRH